MCGEDYCQTCTPDAFMIAWTQGRHHTTPRFDDDNQRRVATQKRWATFNQVQAQNPAAAARFPEFLRVHQGAVYQFADFARLYFDRLIARMAEFAHYAGEHPRPIGAYESGKRWGKRRRARVRWKWRSCWLFLTRRPKGR
jgi:hypothetical protein